MVDIASFILVAVGADINGDVGHSHPKKPVLAGEKVVEHSPKESKMIRG
mgnify:CR=1 FL=1